MSRNRFEILKDELWKYSVLLRRPRVTVREGVRDLVFDAIGTEVYDESWDVLIVLDACRADVLREVASTYPFIGQVETAYSKASSSREWISTNLGQNHSDSVKRTAYVTGNPFSNDYLDGQDFTILDEVWRYAWDQEQGTIPPSALTDRAIMHGRQSEYDQMIVHYMQPHFPSIPNPEIGSAVDPESNVWVNSVWDRLENGTLTRERVWDAYRENLHHVLDSVSILLKNLDAETAIITADHGNGFGEEGIYGHPRLRTHRVLREVPWVVTTATDQKTHEPTTERNQNATDVEVKDRLADLGYR